MKTISQLPISIKILIVLATLWGVSFLIGWLLYALDSHYGWTPKAELSYSTWFVGGSYITGMMGSIAFLLDRLGKLPFLEKFFLGHKGK